nr:transmembrane protein DDB_G0273707/DDB_G0273361-like [Ipomoea batatas]
MNFHRQFVFPQNPFLSQHCRFRLSGAHGLGKSIIGSQRKAKRRRDLTIFASSSSSSSSVSVWDGWLPEKAAAASKAPSLSDIFWPSAGAFAAMAILGKIDQILAPKGVSITIAPLGAVCAVLFATPSSPGARKYNMFLAQIGCAAFGVLALTIFGPGWLARSSALAASIAFMIYTRAVHPPAASLPILFIDAAKLHQLNYWYALFPGATGCILLCVIQDMVCYLKENFKF